MPHWALCLVTMAGYYACGAFIEVIIMNLSQNVCLDDF